MSRLGDLGTTKMQSVLHDALSSATAVAPITNQHAQAIIDNHAGPDSRVAHIEELVSDALRLVTSL